MRPAALLTAAVVTALVPVATADAGTKPTPHTLSDPRGDGRLGSLDITCADIAFPKNEMVVKLTLAAAPGTGTPVGDADYLIAFTMGGTRYDFRMRTAAGLSGTQTWSVRVSDTAPKFTHAVDRDTLVWRLSRRDVPALRRPKLKVTHAVATTEALGVPTDEADTPGACPR